MESSGGASGSGRRKPGSARGSRTPTWTPSRAPGSELGQGAGERLGVPAGRGERGTAVTLGRCPGRLAFCFSSFWHRGFVGVAVGSHVPESRSEPEMLTPASGPFRIVRADCLGRTPNPLEDGGASSRCEDIGCGRGLWSLSFPSRWLLGWECVCSEVSSPRRWSTLQSTSDLSKVKINTTIGPSIKPRRGRRVCICLPARGQELEKMDWPSSLQT